MPKELAPKSIADAWFEPVNGLSGQLRIELEDLNPGLRHAVYLTLRNHTLNPIAVTNQPQIHAELLDSAHHPVSTLGFPPSGPIPESQWGVIPRGACMSFRIDMQTIGVPTREQDMVLLAVGGQAWRLQAGKYVLETVLVYENEADGPQNQWVGELELPLVEFVVAIS